MIKGCSLCKDIIKKRYDSPKMKRYQPYGYEYSLQILDLRAVDNVKSFILTLEGSNDSWIPIKYCPNCGRDLSIQSDQM